MLTIGRLAGYAGVTVRAVRHYHELGLLTEPPRDTAGYRRYGSQDLVDLVRIRTLAEAGVPVARVGDLLNAPPEELSAAVDEIDDGLQRKISDLQATRQRLTQLRSGREPALTAGVAELLDRLREMGVREQTIRMERDNWLLLAIAQPTFVDEWLEWQLTGLDDARATALYRRLDASFDWSADDARIPGLIDDWVDLTLEFLRTRPLEHAPTPVDARALALYVEHGVNWSPAWRRMGAEVAERLQAAYEEWFPTA